MEFSLTDTQLPMFLRIIKLVLALYYGDLNEKASDKDEGKPRDFSVDMSMVEEEMNEDNKMGTESSSWGGWAWNVGTTVGTALLPIYWEDDEDDEDFDHENMPVTKAFETWRDKITHMGLYVDEASFVFKLTEILPKELKSSNTNRFVFSPVLRMDCSGAFMETRAIGVHTVNVTGYY